MEIKEFHCSVCRDFFEKKVESREQRVQCVRCSSIAFSVKRDRGAMFENESTAIADTETFKKAPMGTMPGDDDFIDSQGRVPGDEGYSGPLP